VLPKVTEVLKSNLAYEFVAVGVVWAVVAVLVGKAVVLWPALTCIAAGALLKVQPGGRVTWAWAMASAVLGMLVAGYQAYVAAPFLGGAFSMVAGETFAAFLVFALVHVMLLFTGYTPVSKPAA
jgi:hypothetical protein